MLKPTGAGKVEVDPKYAGAGMLKALLYNFDIDGEALKPPHTQFLDEKVVPLLAADRGHIWMQGSASRSGTNAHNLALSQRRVAKVADYLKARGVAATQMQLSAVGEEMDFGHAAEDAHDRAVALLVLPKARLDPPPPPKPPQPPVTNDHFKIRLLGAVSAGVKVVGVDAMFFQIWDEEHQLAAIFTMGDAGLGKGVLGLPVSVTLEGPWNKMQTTQPIRLVDFEGSARFTTAGGGPWTWNYLNLMGLPPGVATIPRSFRLETGFTIGLGGQTSVGYFKLTPRGPGNPGPFTGP